MKAQRLLALLLRLQAAGRSSAKALAAELEVSERTIHRDVEALAAAGIPVFTLRGSSGGIVLSEGYRRALTQLDARDLESLLVMSADPLADLGLGSSRARVAEQILGALPQAERGAALHTRRRVYIDPGRWYRNAPPSEMLGALRKAAWSDRRIEIDYRDRVGNTTARTLDPLGLVSKAGRWYLVARSGGDYRTFRVDRILRVVEGSEQFVRPPEFDLDAYWLTSTQRLEEPTLRYWITLQVQAERLADLLAVTEHEVVDAERGIVRINYGTADEAVWRLFAWDEAAYVLEPLAFREMLVARARSIVNRYEHAPAPIERMDGCGANTGRMQSSMMTIDAGGSPMPTYVTRPDGEGKLPVVIIVQEIFGITAEMKKNADLLAEQGYAVLIPAMYHRADPNFSAGYDEAGVSKGLGVAKQTTHDDMRTDLAAAIAWIKTQPFASSAIATWGFCWGGSVAYLSATLPDVSAAISFYGGQIAKSPFPQNKPMIEYTAQIHAPLLLAFGGSDHSIPPEEIEKIRGALDAAGKTYELEVYENEGHAFFRNGPSVNDGSAKVWPIVKAFLERYLKSTVAA